jgi:pyrimidine oxygenase
MSDRGFQFSVREADACFIGGRTPDERRDASLRAKKAAEGMGKTIKTYAMCTVIHAETDAKAAALVEHYKDGADMGAILAMLQSWGAPAEKLSSEAAAAGRVHDPDRGRRPDLLAQNRSRSSSAIASWTA